MLKKNDENKVEENIFRISISHPIQKKKPFGWMFLYCHYCCRLQNIKSIFKEQFFYLMFTSVK